MHTFAHKFCSTGKKVSSDTKKDTKKDIWLKFVGEYNRLRMVFFALCNKFGTFLMLK